jgi:hypothetical protein
MNIKNPAIDWWNKLSYGELESCIHRFKNEVEINDVEEFLLRDEVSMDFVLSIYSVVSFLK